MNPFFNAMGGAKFILLLIYCKSSALKSLKIQAFYMNGVQEAPSSNLGTRTKSAGKFGVFQVSQHFFCVSIFDKTRWG